MLMVKERHGNDRFAQTDEVLTQAADILQRRLEKQNCFYSTADTKRFVAAKLQEKEHEVFAVLFLDTHCYLIAYEEMFRGTTNGTAWIQSRSATVSLRRVLWKTSWGVK